MIRLPSYLHCNRYGIYGFRIVIPLDVRVFFKRNEYRMTLFTAERQRAKQLAFGLGTFVHATFDKIRRKNMNGRTTPPEDDFLENLETERNRLLTSFQEICQTDTHLVSLSRLIYKSNQSTIERLASLSFRRQQLSPSADLDKVHVEILATAESLGLTLTIHPDESISNVEDIDGELMHLHTQLEPMHDALFKLLQKKSELRQETSQLEIAWTDLKWKKQNHIEKIEQSAAFEEEKLKLADFAANIITRATQKAVSESPKPAIPEPAKINLKPLSGVIEAYCENQKAESNWTSKTEAENRAIFALWLRIVGDQPIEGYGYEQHRTYKATLLKLPSNINKSPRYKNKSIAEILALQDKPAATNTVNKNLIRIAALFKWAVKYGYTTLNPASGMTIKNPKRASEERNVFTDEDLRKLFHTPDYLNSTHRLSYMRWAPLIALYTGARINEIAQLHLADFIEVEGVQVISINNDAKGKKLKTKAGKRLIPIHPELVRLGLLERVKNLRDQRQLRFFPELTERRDGYGQTVSKWFGRYRKRCGITEEGKVFHSFRHTVVDRLKQADVPKEKIAALVGHEDDSVTFGRYGKDFRPAVMLEVVSMLDSEATASVSPVLHDIALPRRK